jgi:hypothetical protein
MSNNLDESPILKLQTLQSQFSLAMDQYNTAFSNYISIVNSPKPNNSQMKSYLAQIDTLNNKLTDLYSEINQTLGFIEPQYTSSINQNNEKQTSLDGIYSTLMKQKKQISQFLDEGNVIESSHSDSSLVVDSNYMFYKILIIVALIVIFFTVKQFVLYSIPKSQMTGGGKFSFYDLGFNFVLMILLLFLAQTFNHSAGYILWAIFVLTYLLMKFNR